jgi:hypothetical protein
MKLDLGRTVLTAVIPSLQLLREDYIVHQELQMFLPHLFADQEYRNYVAYSEGYKLLDNGAAEGDTYDFQALNYLAQEFRINEVVIPDTIGHCDLTIELARWSEGAFRPEGVKWMAVAQGRNIQELLKCWRELLRLEHVDVIGIPRHINKWGPMQRFTLLDALTRYTIEDFFAKPIHALGSHSWVSEVAALATLKGVRSMDTSLPIHLAALGLDILYCSEGRKRPENYFDMEWSDDRRELARRNVEQFQHWAKETS